MQLKVGLHLRCLVHGVHRTRAAYRRAPNAVFLVRCVYGVCAVLHESVRYVREIGVKREIGNSG